MSSSGLNGGSLTHMRASEAAVSPVADVIHRLGSDSDKGLQCTEAERRQQMHGLNEFDIREEDPLWRKYLNQVSVPSLGCHPVRGLIGSLRTLVQGSADPAPVGLRLHQRVFETV